MTICFVWGYKKSIQGWFDKDDSMQYCIASLTKENSVYLVCRSDQDKQITRNGINWVFCTTDNNIFHFLTKIVNKYKDVIIVTNGPKHLDETLCNKFKQKRLVYYHHGDDPVANFYSRFSLIFTHHQIQADEITKSLGVKTRIAPHTPDLTRFTPNLKIKKDIDVFYPTRPHKLKRSDLTEKACKQGGFTHVISYTIPSNKMPLMYQRSRVVCVTSKIEGGPRIILEAQACNVPVVVCSDCRSCVAYVKRFGGLISEPTPQALVQMINKAFQYKNDSRQLLIKKKYNYAYMFSAMRKGLENL